MECPHCYEEEMEYFSYHYGHWLCNYCFAHVNGMALPGLHYFADGRVHQVINGRCRISIYI